MTIDPTRWYPVAATDDLPRGHVYQTMLGGDGLAIWRAADGRINIWEDRCPHRGVHFSIGVVRGDTLVCRYHAWRFASGTGACTHIPAHPEMKPAAVIRAQAWPVAEASGLVWTGVAPEGTPPIVAGTALRPIPIDRDAESVTAALDAIGGARFFVQPVEAGRSVIRGLAAGSAALPGIDAALEALRRRLEAIAA